MFPTDLRLKEKHIKTDGKEKKRSEETWEHTIENITKQPGKKGTTTTIK